MIIFTDGAASGNPGPGGWGCIICSHDRVIELGGGESHTTNNRMELIALIRALSTVSHAHKDPITVYADSSYVLSGAEKNLANWKKRDWKTVGGEPVKNQDLWNELDHVLSGIKNKISWIKVPAHEGIPGNERCDQIAVAFSKNQPVELYNGTKSSYPIDLTAVYSASGKSNKPWYISIVDGELKQHATWSECESRVKGKKGVKFKKVHSDYEENTALESWGFKKK